MRNRFVEFAGLTFLAAWLAAPADAQVIQNHAYVGAYAVTPAPATGGSQEAQSVGNGALTTGDVAVSSSVTDFPFQNFPLPIPLRQDLVGQAGARTGANASELLGASSSASGDPAIYGFPFTAPPAGGSADAKSVAAWTDIAYVLGPLHPAKLNFTFTIEGQLMATPGQIIGTFTGESSLASVGVGFASAVADFKTQNGPPDPPFGIDYLAQAGYYNSLPAGWTDQNGLLTGTMTFQADYNPTLGGYAFTVELLSQVEASPVTISSNAGANFLDTLALTGVTTVDGTPVDVRFDSGLTMGALPEPSSLIMGLIGLATAGGFALVRPRHARQMERINTARCNEPRSQ